MSRRIYTIIYVIFIFLAVYHVVTAFRRRWKAIVTKMKHGMTPVVANLLGALQAYIIMKYKKPVVISASAIAKNIRSKS